ncbi:MAG TPA: DUF302 domain-containing protein [Thermoanaerobaculia bacterium]|nr:DUF302 domain-containing protein [Thermoanaerobaculia bacterium]
MTTEGEIPNPADRRGVVSLGSPYGFGETVHRLESALTEHGIKVFTVLDQQAEAAVVGLTMPPTTLILFGNPRAGTPLMLARPESGLDLPLKALISESVPGQVTVSFNAASYIVERHALPPELTGNLAGAERLIAKTLGEPD